MNAMENRKDIVLVVDDSPESLGMINDTLDKAGLSVLVALEGGQAIEISKNLTPDIILMDALMPNMDGFEACKRLKGLANLAHIPVIFMTGLSDSESIVKGFESGGVDYITKPVNADELIARMKVHLNNSRLTLSARIALDTAGQFIMTCSAGGEMQWITPQALRVFEFSGLSETWLADHIKEFVEEILSMPANRERFAIVKDGSAPIEIRFIAEQHDGGSIFRVNKLDQRSDEEILGEEYSLTSREAQVLFWLARGKSNSEIAIILGISPRTINKHLEQVFKKVGVENRTSAAVSALRVLENQ